jgi:hypothetical protein
MEKVIADQIRGMAGKESSTPSPTILNASLPSPFLSEGIRRVSDLMKEERFTFPINGRDFDTSIAEAELLSPIVHNLIKHDGSVV